MRYYTASIKITGVTTGKTLLYITVATGKTIELVSAAVVGANATSQQAEITWHKVATLGTPTGTTVTPSRHDNGDTVAGSTVVGNVTANEPTYTSAPNVERGREFGPLVAGWLYPSVPLPREARLRMASGETWGLRSLTTLTSVDLTVRVTFGEEG